MIKRNKNIFPVYKPVGPSSNQVLNIIRRLAQTKKVGHAGTLDPRAGGVLVVAVGRAGTKEIKNLILTDKEYLAVIKLGEESATYDGEGEIKKKSDLVPSPLAINQALAKFIGLIKQKPPIYSALKINGIPAYRLARAGQIPKLKPRLVSIYKIKVKKYKYPFLKLKIACGSGTYIRSLAHDLGAVLKTGAYLYGLERTRVGQYRKSQAKNVEKLGAYLKKLEI